MVTFCESPYNPVMADESSDELKKRHRRILASIDTSKVRYEKISKKRVEGIELEPDCRIQRVDAEANGLFANRILAFFDSATESLDACMKLLAMHRGSRSSELILLRSSLESSSYMIWLLSQPRIGDQVFSTLRLVKEEAKNIEEALGKLPGDLPAPASVITETLQWINRRLGELRPDKSDTKMVPKSKVVENADKSYCKGGRVRACDTGEAAWRMCSACAHGNITVFYATAGKSMSSGSDYNQRRMLWEITARDALLAFALAPAVENIEYCMDLYERSAISPMPNRSTEKHSC